MADEFDCVRCGACCCNPPENAKEGYVDYVEVTANDGIWKRSDLAKRYIVKKPDGSAHLKVLQNGQCAALRGAIGRRVWCEIYYHRPAPCRRVEPGSALCRQYRHDQKLTA